MGKEPMIWYIKAGILLFSALILVPWIYSKIRPNEPSIKEGDYPLKETKISTKFGEFKSSDLPGADMPITGPSMSSASRHTEMEIQKEWLHTDITRRRELYLKKEKDQQKE
ncbi:MAG: hypothetical protein NWE89_02215 [Candidatus Bathyarchaeota archaeon]|nr:hypothetical protein [Candidatus Bathyarchaeota archaeon]